MRVSTVDTTTMQKYGRYLLNEYRDSCHSFEEAAQKLVENCYQEFRTDENEPEFALIRIFRTTKYAELCPKLQQQSRSQAPQLALMGTVGIEEAWNSWEASQSRQLIPIGETMSPMFQGVFNELGFQMDAYHAAAATGQAVHSMKMLRYFHVPNAHHSAAITDQEKFVKAYGIKSVIAVGTQFLSQQAYVMIGFSRYNISHEQAEILAELAPHISTLLAIFDGRQAFWRA